MNTNNRIVISRCAQCRFTQSTKYTRLLPKYTSVLAASFLLMLSACSSESDSVDTSPQSSLPVIGAAEAEQHINSLRALQDASSDENGYPTPLPPDPGSPEFTTPEVSSPEVTTPEASKPDETANLSGAVQTAKSFSSHTTNGFTGTLGNDNAVTVTWSSFPSAIGYNVYRNSEFYRTVFTSRFVDTDVANHDSLYYEIEAYDEPRNFTRIARGLTVQLQKKTAKLPAQIEAGYDLVFSDEFNGNTLDNSKWNTSYIWGDQIIINSELQFYVDINNRPDFPFNPFEVGGGVLEINTVPTPQHLKSQANNQPYLSGVITSYDAFKFTYGYAEARIKLPKGRGFWAAFWLLNAYYDKSKPEIDIMEHLGHKLDSAYHTYHYYDNDDVLHSSESENSTGADFTGDFHVFAAEWKPGTIIYYIDGIERHRITDANVSDEEMYIIANTAIGGWWPGDPDETTEFPGSYQIDYIRAYQKRGQLDPLPQFDGVPATLPVTHIKNPSPNHLPPFELWPAGYPSRAQ